MEHVKATTLKDLRPDPKNPNKGSKRGSEMIEASLREYGAGRSIVLDRKNRVISGNKTRVGAMAAGMKDVQIVDSDGTKVIAVRRNDLDLTRDKKARELATADNRSNELSLSWDLDILKGLDIDPRKFFTDDELLALDVSSPIDTGATSGNLAAQFLVPPFSVLDARQGYWQDRKRAWLALGIESELGRGAAVDVQDGRTE